MFLNVFASVSKITLRIFYYCDSRRQPKYT